MKLNKIYRLAILMSRIIDKSITHKKHVAAIIRNGKILKARPNCAGFHAETQVIKNQKNKDSVMVIRYENGIFKNSKPCKHCIDSLKATKIKKIIYSTGDSNQPFVKENINNITNDWIAPMKKNKKLFTCKR